MAEFAANQNAKLASGGRAVAGRPGGARRLPLVAQHALALLLVAAASALAFVVENLIAAPNLTLIYVLPVIAAASAFGWWPALVAALAGMLCFDFFFTQPYFSFRIYSASDIWAAALLLATAATVATLAAQARRRALEAQRTREQAEALQGLAHVVIEQRPQAEVLQAAAETLNQIFQAPAVIYLQDGGAFRRAASSGDPEITTLDEEAARGAMAAQLHTRAESYPYDQAEFEFWPVTTPLGCRCVLGVDFTSAEAERPEAPERFTDVVAAYLAVALKA